MRVGVNPPINKAGTGSSRNEFRLRVLSLSILAALSVASGSVHADDGSVAQLPVPTPPTTQGGDVPSQQAEAPQAAATETDKFVQLNQLTLKGWATPVPTFNDTLTQDLGGWRSSLASLGIGFAFWSTNTGVYDLAQAGRNIPGPQLYNGQKFTYQVANQTAVLTYDASRLGLPDGGQFAFILAGSNNGYEARDGRDGVRIKGLSWYQPVAQGKVEFELGYIANQTDYMGTSVGGSLAGGALGPTASIPVEVGMSYGQFAAPTASARVNWTDKFYTRTAIQRSITPQGSAAEWTANPSGVDFESPGGRAMVIQEIGYRSQPTPQNLSTWVRAGGAFNDSYYNAFSGGKRHNEFGYIAVDQQLTQNDLSMPGRGVYVGATFNAAPKDVDLISSYYEARIYGKGVLASRPYDMASLVAAINVYSPTALHALDTPTFSPYSTTQTYTVSYSYRVRPGLYLQPGLSAVVHPVYNRKIGTAWNALLSLVIFI
jgi:porin